MKRVKFRCLLSVLSKLILINFDTYYTSLATESHEFKLTFPAHTKLLLLLPLDLGT